MAEIRRLPFTEMTERVMTEMVRDSSTAEAKYKGRINDAYLVAIPSQIDWVHIRKTASITTKADYNTGHVYTITGTTVTGSSTAWTSLNSNNMLLKVSGNNEIYRVTYSAATTLTLDRTWVETDISATNTDYTLFQDRYALASDYDRLILDPNKSVYYWLAGNPVYLQWRDPDTFETQQTYQEGFPTYYTIKWISGDPYIFIDPPDDSARTINYVYMPLLTRMSEYTTGTITTLANAGTAVTGSSTDFDGYVSDTSTYDYYFRLDRDGTGSASVWYKVASASSNTALVLSDVYTGTAVSAGTLAYTISKISLLPAGLDLAIVYGAAIVSAVDQGNSKQATDWGVLYSTIINQYRSIEGKENYGQQRLHTIYERSGVRR